MMDGPKLADTSCVGCTDTDCPLNGASDVGVISLSWDRCCPRCGASMIESTRIYSTDECGSDIFQVDFACGTSRQSRFAGVVDHVYWQVTRFNNISPVCTEMSNDGLTSDII